MQIVCPECGGINRVPENRSASSAKCGKCKQPLFQSKPYNASSDVFLRQLQKNDIPVVVDFWASWCGPCKMMAPMFEQAAAQLEPDVRLLKVNTETEQSIAAQYNIRSIPTMIIYRHGKELARTSGAMDSNQIISWVKQSI